ncbi:MAG: hypothetical protein IH955_01255 [Chloroflexi bacterium]|nr:hypothetical protein [Chloroflexota bacterium]
MGFDQDQFKVDMRRRIKERQEQLKELPDNELMRLSEGIYDLPEEKRDAALMAAAFNEVQRRSIAAGWFWRRWFKRQEYEKWVEHNKTTEAKATLEAIDIFQKYDDPKSQEAVRRLRGHVRDINDTES